MSIIRIIIGLAGLLLYHQDNCVVTLSASDMVRLRNDLLTNYSVGVLPLKNQSYSLHVNMSFFLIMIHNLNMKNQVLTTGGWLKFEWCDEFLQWDPREYGSIDELILFQKDVWLPDIFVENTAQHYRELGNNQMLISVKSSGMIHWEPGIITETICAVNIGKYPFDTQTCDIRFLTWMHTNKTLTVGPKVDRINLDALLPNGEWDITSTEAKEYRYPSTYRMGTDHTGTTFVVHLRRKRFFYALNTIIPVMMLSCLNVLVFILPSDCGERMALAVAVLLAFTVYLSIISDNIPKTSESLSILAIYLTTLLALSTASVICAGIVLNIHYRDPTHPVPKLLAMIFSGSRRRNSVKQSESCVDSRRTPMCQWDKRPTFWDQRRPSIWTKRLTLRESQRGRNTFADSSYDERDELESDTEKAPCSPGLRCNFPAKQPIHETIGMHDHVQITAENRGRERRKQSEVSVGSSKYAKGENHHTDGYPGSSNNSQYTFKRIPTDMCGAQDKDHVNKNNFEEKRNSYKDITWHDIGNSLDRSLFWVFFLVTNSVTISIMVLFVKDD